MTRTAGFIFASLLVIVLSCSRKTKDMPMGFNGSLEELRSTEIVLSLDAPLPARKNAIWCASGQSLLATVKHQIEKHDYGTYTSADSSNYLAATTPARFPSQLLYVAVGLVSDGIIDRISDDLTQRLQDKTPPSFPQLDADTFVGYSYLESGVKFPHPYRQNSTPFTFTAGSGLKSEVNSFGLPPEDYGRYKEVRAQARVLFVKGDVGESNLEFAVDLCSNSSPSQIVVALIAPESSLAAAYAKVQKASAAAELSSNAGPASDQSICPDDSLLVPDFCWAISQHFSQPDIPAELMLKDNKAVFVQQEILFRLNRYGTELKSWGIVAHTVGVPRRFHCDRPFLVYLKRRDASEPYFAMWIDNVELMSLWQGKK